MGQVRSADILPKLLHLQCIPSGASTLEGCCAEWPLVDSRCFTSQGSGYLQCNSILVGTQT